MRGRVSSIYVILFNGIPNAKPQREEAWRISFFVWIEIKRPTIDQPWQRAMCPSIPKMSNVFKREMSANERKRDREGDREQDISRSSQGFFAKKSKHSVLLQVIIYF